MLKRIFLSFILFSFFLPSYVQACSVPVFRYSIERWRPNPYLVRVFYKGKLDENQQAAVDYLKKIDEKQGPIILQMVDLGKEELPANAAPVYERNKAQKLPFVVANYHLFSRIPNDAAVCPLSLKNVKDLLISPARQELGRRLLKGDSAVFIQVDGEDEKENKKIAEQVKSYLEDLEKELKLPHETLEEGEELDGESMEYDTDVKIKFSLQRINKKDPKEQLFMQVLLNCEKELPNKKTPIIMPVFGRGRALYAYLEAGITKDNIQEAGAYLTGPCSCEIKAQNPGFDVLMDIPWDELVHDTIKIDEVLPPLTGLTTSVKREEPVAPEEEINLKSEATMNEKPKSQQLGPSLLMTIAGIVILTFIVMKFLSRK